MSYSVNWIGKVITIPTSDLTLVSGTEYDLNMSNFWLEIRRLEALPTEGLWAPQILSHANTRTLAGTTFIMENEIINGYTVQFSGVATRVNVKADNDNLADVFLGGLTLVTFNSAGNTITTVGSGVTAQDKIDIIDELMTRVMESGETFAEQQRLIRAEAAGDIEVTGTTHKIKAADGIKDRITATADAAGRDVTAVDGS